jgi:hypothetical protein
MNKKNDEMIIKYLNHELNDEEKLVFFYHIKTCEKFRSDLALMIKLQKTLTSQVQNVPIAIKREAFVKIKAEKALAKIRNLDTELVNLVKKDFPIAPFKVLTCVLFNIRDLITIPLKLKEV